MASLYRDLRRLNQLLEVDPDDLDILVYDIKSRTKAIGTKGLNGCTCIVILGKLAIILAHISPYPGEFDASTSQNIPQQSYRHHETSLVAVTDLVKRNLQHFPASTTAWGVFATNEDSRAVQSIIDQVRNGLRAMSLDMRCAYYQEASISSILPPKGELVSFFKDGEPKLVLERRQLWPAPGNSSQSSASGSSRQATTVAMQSPQSLAVRSSRSSSTSPAAPQASASQFWAGYPTRTDAQGGTWLNCVISGQTLELAANWPQGVNNLPMVWIQNSWSQTGRSPDNVLLLERMAEFQHTTGTTSEANFDEILRSLCEPDDQEQAVLEAVRNGDELTLRQTSIGPRASLRAKLEAVMLKKHESLRILLERNNIISDNVVTEAFQRQDKESIRVLLDFGWDINSPFCSAPPLCFAVNNEEFMRWLIDNGADINFRPELDLSVLTNAIAVGDIAVVRLLLSQGADVLHGNLLHSAIERKDEHEGAELVEYLARRGVDVNARRHGTSAQKAMSFLPTPLYLACDKENIPAVRALLRHGADPTREVLHWGRNGPSALDRARSINNPELSRLLFGGTSKF